MNRVISIGIFIFMLIGSVNLLVTEQNFDIVNKPEGQTDTQGISQVGTRGARGSIPHAIIRINNNTDFQFQASGEGWPGIGTINNPYIIQNYLIDAQGAGSCIYIGNTTVHFIINNCTLLGANGNGSPVNSGAGITLNSVNNGRLISNNITNNRLGIYSLGSNFNLIYNNNCSLNNATGIFLNSTSDYNEIINNSCKFNNYSGMCITLSRYNTIENNICNHNNESGIKLETLCNNNVFYNNTCYSNNHSGIYLFDQCYDNFILNSTCNLNGWDGIRIFDASNGNDFINNTCILNVLGGIYSYNSDYNSYLNNTCLNGSTNGIGIIQCSSNIIKNNTCINNSINGIMVYESTMNLVENNTCNLNGEDGIRVAFNANTNNINNNFCDFNDNWGITVLESSYCTSYNNTLSNNSDGVYLTTDSNYNTFYDNDFVDNTVNGIRITSGCNQNRFFHNNIISNTNQASDNGGSTSWDNGNYEGNYWSDYTGLDNGAGGRDAGDGIGDTELQHPGTGYDNYPFMARSGWLSLPPPQLFDPGELSRSGTYNVTWNTSLRVTSYVLFEDINWSFDSPIEVFNGSGSSVELTGRNNDTYYYRLRTYNTYTTSPFSEQVELEVDWQPAPPTGLTAQNSTGNTITLTWDPHPEPDVKSIYLMINSTDGSGYQVIGFVPGISTKYTVTNLADETTYSFVIMARDNYTLSQYSNVASETTLDITSPAAPTGLNATGITDKEILLEWDSNIESDLAGYIVYMNDTDYSTTGDFHVRQILPNDKISYLVTGLSEQVTYYFKLRAFDDVPNNSTFSEVVSATTPDITRPSKPTGLIISNPTQDSLTISWDANSDHDLIGYNLYRSYSSSGEYKLINSELITDTQYTDLDLNESTTYYYKVKAVDDTGLESPFSDFALGITLIAPHPPEINNSINDFTIPEDIYDDYSINLYYLFKDVNSDPLTFLCQGQKHINVTIFNSNGTVILEPEENWNGKETLTFHANDGIFTISVQLTINISVTFVNDPPGNVKIRSPQDSVLAGVELKSGNLLTLKGTADDPDLVYGDELTFEWLSDKDDLLGKGENLTDIKLSIGEHEITLKVTDNAGASSTANIKVIVQKESASKKDDLNFILSITGVVIVIIVILLVLFIVLKKKKKELEIPTVEAEIETEEQPPGEVGTEQLADSSMPMPAEPPQQPLQQPQSQLQPPAQEYIPPQPMQEPSTEIELGLPPTTTEETIPDMITSDQEPVEERAFTESPSIAPSHSIQESIPQPQEPTDEPTEQKINESEEKDEQQQNKTTDS